jgi:hypothetical protein
MRKQLEEFARGYRPGIYLNKDFMEFITINKTYLLYRVLLKLMDYEGKYIDYSIKENLAINQNDEIGSRLKVMDLSSPVLQKINLNILVLPVLDFRKKFVGNIRSFLRSYQSIDILNLF